MRGALARWRRTPKASCVLPRDGQHERGSAIVEFLGLGVLLGVPLFYVLVSLSQFQAAALASVSISEQASRLYAQAPDAATADGRLRVAVAEMAGGYRLDPATVHVNVGCAPRCFAPGSTVTARVTIDVPLPLMPAAARVGTVSADAAVATPRFG